MKKIFLIVILLSFSIPFVFGQEGNKTKSTKTTPSKTTVVKGEKTASPAKGKTGSILRPVEPVASKSIKAGTSISAVK